ASPGTELTIPALEVKAEESVAAVPAREAEAAQAAAPQVTTRKELTERLLRIVGERTGYPPDMLSLTADVEAELGIDSIKRVEIIGALRRAAFSRDHDIGADATEQLTAIKTLGGIVDWVLVALQDPGQPEQEQELPRT